MMYPSGSTTASASKETKTFSASDRPNPPEIGIHFRETVGRCSMALRLLHYSDLEKAYDDPGRIGRVAGQIRARRDGETLVVGTGDDLGPGVLSLRTRSRQALDFFAAVEPDAETLGNHDFDHGPAVARELIAASPQPWVCANAYERDGTTRFGAEEGLVPWTVLEASDHRVGVVGLTHPDNPAMNPKTESLSFTDPFEAASEAIATVRAKGVDHVVVLSHCGDLDDELAKAVDVDAILGGHLRDERIDRRDGTLLARPGADGHHLVEVVLGEEPTATLLDTADAPVDERVHDAIQKRVADMGLDEVVGTVAEPIDCGKPRTQGGESRVGNFVTDAFRWAADADVTLMASGSVRVGPTLSGEVRAMDVMGLCPWDNHLDVLSLPGDRLLEAFRELSVTYHYPDAPEWYFGHVSGATLTWDGRDGDRLDARVGGESVREDATYTLATVNYLVETDHLCRAFDDSDRVERLGLGYEHLVEYAREVGIEPAVGRRIVTGAEAGPSEPEPDPTGVEESSRGI
jgi:2',3'-cyclic-nucleotide 2'-phosphodiesterase (5'-nucleotidase family)